MPPDLFVGERTLFSKTALTPQATSSLEFLSSPPPSPPYLPSRRRLWWSAKEVVAYLSARSLYHQALNARTTFLRTLR